MDNTQKTPKSLLRIANIKGRINDYSESGSVSKKVLHKAGLTFLTSVASDLGLKKDDYSIRSNKGGIAVSGEITLHGESIYISLHESFGGDSVDVLFRNCHGRSDYSGGMNNYANVRRLSEGGYSDFISRCSALMDEAKEVVSRPRAKM